MRIRLSIAVSILFILGLLSTIAVAQHGGHHPQATAPEQQKNAMMESNMMGGHQELEKLFDKVQKSFAELRNEKNASALRAKLEKHAELLQQFQTAWTKQSAMMNEHMKMCPMMDWEHKK